MLTTVCLVVFAALSLIPPDNYRPTEEPELESGLLPMCWSEWRKLLIIVLLGVIGCLVAGWGMADKMGAFTGIEVTP
jgi:hypothetical protein